MKHFRHHLFVTLSVFFICLVIFSASERGIAVAGRTAQIVAKQQVTDEISVSVSNSAVTMIPPIPGLTGGVGNGSTTVNIITNNNTGYYVNLDTCPADDCAGASAMEGDTQGGVFGPYRKLSPDNDYRPETWHNADPGTASQFGYGMTYLHLSSQNQMWASNICDTDDSCFFGIYAPGAMYNINLISVPTFTSSEGDSFVLKFRAQIPAMSNPLMPEDLYTATTSITVITY